MLSEEEKKYWKKVYMYFGNDLTAWHHDNGQLKYEFIQNPNLSAYNLYTKGYALDDKFTQKFIDEISDVD